MPSPRPVGPSGGPVPVPRTRPWHGVRHQALTEHGTRLVPAPIGGATNTRHLSDAVAALALERSDDEVAQLEAPSTGRPPRLSWP